MKSQSFFPIMLLALVLLVSCTQPAVLASTPTTLPTITSTSTSTATSAPISTLTPLPTYKPKYTLTPIPSATAEAPTAAPIPSFSQSFPFGLRVEEYALKAAPQVEPRTFDPLQSSQAAILEKHSMERQDYYSAEIVYGEERLVYAATGKSPYVAKEIYSYAGGPIKVTVEVMKEDHVIYSAPAGDVSPLDHVQGLWVYGGHWTVEYANITNTMQKPGEIDSNPVGQIVQDGILLNKHDGLQDAFGFQLIGDEPFYFFKKADQIGVSYAEQTLPLGYDEIPHYRCCSYAALNPIHARNMIAFFARREATWYYVEIGQY
jgi:hypothetical protein